MILTTRNSSYNKKVGVEFTEPNACGHCSWEIFGQWTKQEHHLLNW